MNTNHLKRFAQEARRKLLEQVGAKLNFVLTTDSAELREKTEQLKQLRQEIGRTTKEQLIEKVAYTWFNRLMALRFMDVNDYQPLGIRVITPKDGYTIPELLDEAKRGNIPDELKVNRQRINDLLDSRIPSKNTQNETFKELLIAACNHLHTAFPFLFEKISDYTELLLPDDLTSDFSILNDVRQGMLIEDCKNVEIIGWLYQFYISEKKDEVTGSKSKVKKEDIPAATQLFTPRWIVEYIVQNTLGKLWLQNRPKSKLREYMQYFIESASLTSDDFLKVNSPEEIRLVDPASGSGHILVYAFDLFTKIYEEEGYNIIDIPKLIIEKNLYGFEIDERAAQLSGLTLLMKAREYQRRAFRKDLQPNIFCFQDLNLSKHEIKETISLLHIIISEELMHDLLQMQQATNFGSLIIPHSNKKEILNIYEKLNLLISNADVFQRSKIDSVLNSCSQLFRLTEKYHCVVTNPPYMGGGNMDALLSEFVKNNYPDSKSDLMACFMESGLIMLQKMGFLGMINQHSWMFLSSYEGLRRKLIESVFFDTLLHLGARTFPEISGEVVQNASFTFWNKITNKDGNFLRLVDFEKSEQKRTKTLEAIKDTRSTWFFIANQKDFYKISGSPIGYWISKNLLSAFNQTKLNEIANVKAGLSTGDNERFLRYWHEIDINKLSLSKNQKEKWIPLHKGGSVKKWYGNQDLVVNWENDGYLIRNFKDSKGRLRSRPQGLAHNFKNGLTWSALSNSFNVRISSDCFIYGSKGPGITFEKTTEKTQKELLYILGLLNSTIAKLLIGVQTQNLSFEVGHVGSIPVKIVANKLVLISEITQSCVDITKINWDSNECSWDFTCNQLIKKSTQDLEEATDIYYQYWKKRFIKLHQNEEDINLQFIEIYGLVDEISPNVPFEDITILQDELDLKFLSKLNKKLIRDPVTFKVKNYLEVELPFIASEVMAQFISYSVGCMMGRYSLDKEGLILANQGDTIEDYLQEIYNIENKCTYHPDADNIIPVLDNEWFEDDIVAKFNRFLKVTFGEKYFSKNIAYIEEQIGKDIRKYFLKDFYPDHIRLYKKRPIYWMFSSPKGSFNVLIYMHRYTPDTVSNILNKYLKEFTGKLNTRREHLEHVQVTGSASDKTKAIKEIDNIEKMLVELHGYERDILYPLATERIEINLDDGVLVNYNKFGKAVKEVNGLNDPATKKKVKQFDWIDTSQIR